MVTRLLLFWGGSVSECANEHRGVTSCHGCVGTMAAAHGAENHHYVSDEWEEHQTSRVLCSTVCVHWAVLASGQGLTMDLLMWVSLLLALLSANSRLLMSFSRARYFLICSLTRSSTHLWGKMVINCLSSTLTRVKKDNVSSVFFLINTNSFLSRGYWAMLMVLLKNKIVIMIGKNYHYQPSCLSSSCWWLDDR